MVRMEYDEDGDLAEVEMTPPIYESPGIPAKGKGDFHEIINGYRVFAVNTGVPHAVIFVRDLDSLDLIKMAPPIRHSQFFPSGANVNFVEITGENSIQIRTSNGASKRRHSPVGPVPRASTAIVSSLQNRPCCRGGDYRRAYYHHHKRWSLYERSRRYGIYRDASS